MVTRLPVQPWATSFSLGKLKPNKLSTGCQNELKRAAIEKATNPGRRFQFFSRLRRSIVLPTKPPCYKANMFKPKPLPF